MVLKDFPNYFYVGENMNDKQREKERASLLGDSPIHELLIKFSVPAIVGMVVNALYNIVDRIFIGRIADGSIAIGAIYVTLPVSLILMAFAMLVGIGGNTLASIRFGEGRKEEADTIANNSLLLLGIIGIVLSILGLIFIEPILKIFGASETNIGYAMDYLRIILIGAPLQTIGFGMNNFIRGEGNPKIAMLTMIIGAVTNTILDPIFIFGFNMGVKGAALATIIGQILSAIWVLRYFFSGKSMLTLKPKYLKFSPHAVKEIIANGTAPFSMQIAASMVTGFFNNSLQHYGGDLAVSSMGVVNSVSMMILMPIFGMNQGAQPIIGFNYGAKKYDRVKKTLRYSIIAAVSVTTFGFIVVESFPELILRLFISNPNDFELMANYAVPGLRIFFLIFPMVGFQIISTAYFQATGKPRQAMFLSLSRQVLLLIPAMLIFPLFFDLNGVWMAAPFADFFTSLLTAILLYRNLRTLN